MKKVDHKVLSELFAKEIKRLENEVNGYNYYRSPSDKSHKREMKRKLKQVNATKDRILGGKL